jgi:hypothetical protein
MQKNLKILGAIAILGASLALSGFAIQDAMAASANKSVFSTAEPQTVFSSELTALGLPVNGTVIAETSMKTSKPQDALVLYNEECSLYTEVNLKSKKGTVNTNDELDSARAAHLIQLYVDGTPVGDMITMCDRTYGISTNILTQIQDICDTLSVELGTSLECEETFLDSWIATKSAHGWNWVVLDLGQVYDPNVDEHKFEVVGYYVSEDVSPNKVNDDEAVVIGQRSLIVIPTHLGNDTTE